MYIVFLTHEYPSENNTCGGIGTFVKYLANHLTQNSFRVTVIGAGNKTIDEHFFDNEVEIFILKKSTWKFAKFKDHFNRILKKIEELNQIQKIDIIEGSELNFAFFPKKTKYKKVIRLHGGHHFFASELNKKPALWRGYQEKKSFRNADEFIAVSNYVGDKTKELLDIEIKFSTIYNGIDLSNFYKSNTSKEILGKLVFIGTVCYKKGIDNLLLAYKILKEKHPHLSLDIIGRDWSTKEIPSYILYLKEKYSHCIDKSVVFRGSVKNNEIQKYIESAEICVYPSLSESFGLTVIEAMAMGKAVAISNIKPFKEIVEESESALLFNPKNVNSISDKITEILNNKTKKKELEEKSRNHIFTKFKTKNIIGKNIQFYKSIT